MSNKTDDQLVREMAKQLDAEAERTRVLDRIDVALFNAHRSWSLTSDQRKGTLLLMSHQTYYDFRRAVNPHVLRDAEEKIWRGAQIIVSADVGGFRVVVPAAE